MKNIIIWDGSFLLFLALIIGIPLFLGLLALADLIWPYIILLWILIIAFRVVRDYLVAKKTKSSFGSYKTSAKIFGIAPIFYLVGFIFESCWGGYWTNLHHGFWPFDWTESQYHSRWGDWVSNKFYWVGTILIIISVFNIYIEYLKRRKAEKTDKTL